MEIIMKTRPNQLTKACLTICIILIAIQSPALAANTDLTLFHTFPATDWQSHCFPIGNGKMGAMTFGDTNTERIQFNVDSLWTGDQNPSGKYDKQGMGAYQNFGEVIINLANSSAPPAVHSPSNHKPYYAAESIESTTDSNPKTKWCVEHNNRPVQWQLSLPENQPAAVNSYSFTSAPDAPKRDPKNWNLTASNDQQNWTTLDTRTNLPSFDKRGQTKTFSFDNGRKFRFYRFIFQPNENIPRLQLGGITLKDIDLTTDSPAAENYRRSLDLSTAVHTVTYTNNGATFTRQSFCTTPHKILAVRLSADKSKQYTGSISLNGAHKEKTSANTNRLTFTGQFANGLQYEAQLMLVPTGGKVTAENDTLTFDNCDSLLVLLAADTNYTMDYSADFFTTHPHNRLSAQLNYAAATPYDTLLARHIADHQSLFNRVTLDLGQTDPDIAALPTDKRIEAAKTKLNDPDLEEVLFQYGRYLLISSSRPGTLPANLQGLWNNSNTPPWHSDYHTNINVQMNYWLAEPANLADCHTPFIDLTEQIIPPSREATSKAFGTTKGFTFRTSHNIYGGNGWKWNTPASAWYCQHIWEHYAFSGDTEYLRHTAYPILKEVTQFWQQHLKKLPDGTLVAPNGWSPEHGPEEDGVSYDQQIVWDLLTNTIEASEILKIDHPFRTQVEKMRSKLLGPKIGKWGQLQEWVNDRDDPKDQHRHTSHLFAVYPGRQISISKTPDLAKAAATSLEARGQSGDSRRSWTWPWRCALWARLQQPQKAYNMIEGLLKYNTMPNLITTHPPLQLDGSFGITAGFCEMLLQSHADEINLLPAIPSQWMDGSVTGLRARGGFQIDIKWKDGKLTETAITPNHTTTRKVRYGTITKTISFKKNQKITLNEQLEY